ncbi:17133_t:CDS:2 [Entrophospora sp. SA101]|nr:17133_t:CDS:2 [Entrophospora sp. SA101]
MFGQSRDEEVIEMDNVKLIENESLQQTLIMREQDKQLESLYGTARNIHEIAATIGNELEDQKIEIEYNFLAVITLYDSWNRIYNTVSSRNNEELKRTEEELEPIIKSIEMVESDPVKYSFITSKDIESRREFVEQKKEKLKTNLKYNLGNSIKPKKPIKEKIKLQRK